MEIWKEIKGYNGVYFVSNKGTVKSVDHYCKGRIGSEKHHMSKLSNKEVLKARYLYKIGFTNKELAEDYNVSQTAMSNILRNKTYKNVK